LQTLTALANQVSKRDSPVNTKPNRKYRQINQIRQNCGFAFQNGLPTNLSLVCCQKSKLMPTTNEEIILAFFLASISIADKHQ
jgi:hypothetical protein